MKKPFLYATAFFSGMSIMAIEMGASRLLTPYFSSSQVIWTIIIGIIMIAMAIGNVWGGRAADKNPDPARLYRRLLIAAIWTAALPFAGRYVLLGVTYVVVKIVHQNYLVFASFFSCLVLFVFPLILLGTTTPSLIKYSTDNLTDNGKTVGTIEACGTIGSILGTFLPTFVTIPSFGTAITFYIFAGILALLSLIFFISRRKHIVKAAGVVGLVVVLMFAPINYSFAFWDDKIIYEGESIYNYLRVEDEPEQIILSTNVLAGVQSVYRKGGGLAGMYYDYQLAVPLIAGEIDDPTSLLILGMGTGTYAKTCLDYYPNMKIEGVEIDEKIVDLSRKYFELPENVPVTVEDGRAFLRNAGTYDIIMVDAYQDITIPFQMSSVEFFTMVKEHLSEDGVMLVNLNMRTDTPGGINQWLIDTICSVFPAVVTVDVEGNTNREVFACRSMEQIEKGRERVERLPEDSPLKPHLRKVMANLQVQTGGDRIFTDDKAPVEILGMDALDKVIQDTLEWNGGIDAMLQF